MPTEHVRVDVTPTTSATLEHELSALPGQQGGEDIEDDSKPMLDKQEPCPPNLGGRWWKLKITLAFVGAAILLSLIVAGSGSTTKEAEDTADDAVLLLHQLTGITTPPRPAQLPCDR